MADNKKEMTPGQENVARIGVASYFQGNPFITTGVAGEKPKRTRKAMLVNPRDIAILRYTLRYAMLTGSHLVAFTGLSKDTVYKRARMLVADGYLTTMLVPLRLRSGYQPDSELVDGVVQVYIATRKGADLCGEWDVPGTFARDTVGHRIPDADASYTDENGIDVVRYLPRTVHLEALERPSRALAPHTLAVADLAAWFTTFQFKCASEREMRSLEQAPPPGRYGNARTTRQYWSNDWCLSSRDMLMQGDTGGIHPPDLGVIEPGRYGRRWAIELEHAQKSVSDYETLMGAYAAANLGHMWFITRPGTKARLEKAAYKKGIRWAPGTTDYLTTPADAADQVRLAGFLPAPTTGQRPSTWVYPDGWPILLPRTPPPGWRGLKPLTPEKLRAPIEYHRVPRKEQADEAA